MIRYRRNDDVVTRDIAGETVVVPVTGRMVDLESIYTLDGVGSFVWKLVGTGATVGAIVEAVASEYEVSLETADADVREYLEALESEGLVRRWEQ